MPRWVRAQCNAARQFSAPRVTGVHHTSSVPSRTHARNCSARARDTRKHDVAKRPQVRLASQVSRAHTLERTPGADNAAHVLRGPRSTATCPTSDESRSSTSSSRIPRPRRLLRSDERAAAGKYREPLQRPPLAIAEQFVAPIDRRPHGLLARQARVLATRENYKSDR